MIKKKYLAVVALSYSIVIAFSYWYCSPCIYEDLFRVMTKSILISLAIATVAMLWIALNILGLGKRLMEWTSGFIRFVPYVFVFCLGVVNMACFIIMMGNMDLACITWLMPMIIGYYAAKMISYELEQSTKISTDIANSKNNNKLLKRLVKYVYVYVNIVIFFIVALVWMTNIIIFDIHKSYILYFFILCILILLVSWLFLWGVYYSINKVLDT